MSRFIVIAVVLLATPVFAFDTRCRATDPDCEGEEAARTPWVQGEHASLWLEARQLAGLPEAVDAPFLVRTPVLSPGSSLAPAPLDLATAVIERRIEIAVFAQLPDLSYTLWDWTSGNEGCPPSSTGGFAECHAFRGHMGWLNSTHFLPQAEQIFFHLHGLAVERARACARMQPALEASGDVEILKACDREALLIEAQAHHYLQDAWSMGHMWQRWGSPELEDFAASVRSFPGEAAPNAEPATLKAIGDAVGRGSGIIHGAKTISGFDDAMCGPQPGVEFVHDGVIHEGAGDLFVTQLRTATSLHAQRDLMQACFVSAMREVYDAGAQALGAPVESSLPAVPLSSCFPQRATNRAIGLGAAVQLPAGLESLPPLLANAVLKVHDEYLVSVGIDPDETTTIFLPLTSEVLTQVNGAVELYTGEPLFAPSVLNRWHADMARIQLFLSQSAILAPLETTLANGGLGELLGMKANSAYTGVPGYTDPTLPWRPQAAQLPLEPRVENAGNIIARTFVDAHVDDWCGVLHEAGDDEFSLRHLQDRCTSLTEQGATEAEAACDVCASFAEWMVFDPEPDVAANPGLAGPPICTILAGTPGIEAESAAGDFDRAALARRWCTTTGPLTVTAALISREHDFAPVGDAFHGGPSTILVCASDENGAVADGRVEVDGVERGTTAADGCVEVDADRTRLGAVTVHIVVSTPTASGTAAVGGIDTCYEVASGSSSCGLNFYCCRNDDPTGEREARQAMCTLAGNGCGFALFRGGCLQFCDLNRSSEQCIDGAAAGCEWDAVAEVCQGPPSFDPEPRCGG